MKKTDNFYDSDNNYTNNDAEIGLTKGDILRRILGVVFVITLVVFVAGSYVGWQNVESFMAKTAETIFSDNGDNNAQRDSRLVPSDLPAGTYEPHWGGDETAPIIHDGNPLPEKGEDWKATAPVKPAPDRLPDDSADDGSVEGTWDDPN